MENFQQKNQINDKILGALWGAVLGDVIGAFLQFDKDVNFSKVQKAFTIPGGGKHSLESGQPTDDSELNYAVCKALLRGNGNLNLNFIAQQMGNWFLSKPIDVGNTIRNSVPKACNMKTHQAHLCRKGAKQKSQNSQSNGTLMALIGLSLWCYKLQTSKLIEAIRQYTILIHPNQMVTLCNSAYTLMIQFYLQNQDQQDPKKAFQSMKNSLKQNKGMFWAKNFEQFQIWLNVIEKSFEDIKILQQAVPITKLSGWVRVAFSYAVYFAVKQNQFKKPIEYLISAKGDTDTNACIAGGLLGAKLGLKKMTELNFQIEKIREWRPKKKIRPEWMVPGLVIDKIANFIYKNSPIELKMVGSTEQYKK